MKKWIAPIIICILLLAIVAYAVLCMAAGPRFMEYDLNEDGTYTVVGIGRCTDTNLEIPATYRGAAVTRIGSFAFWNCSNLTSITIPDSVTSLAQGVFRDCYNLTSITVDANNSTYHSEGNCIIYTKTYTLVAGCMNSVIPDYVTIIDAHAFDDCRGLTSITIPDSVTIIGDRAFYWCGSLTSITIPEGVTSIGDSAFVRCRSLTSITIPDGVTSIGNAAFDHCFNLTSITIPDSVTSIGDKVFYCCFDLTSITYTGTVEQWETIKLGSNWNEEVPATEVICSDGTVSLQN